MTTNGRTRLERGSPCKCCRARSSRIAGVLSVAVACWLSVTGGAGQCFGTEVSGADYFREQVQPILESYCYGCHGYGAAEGGRTLDEFPSDEALMEDTDLWQAVLKNVRANVMPPAEELRPSEHEREILFGWIKRDVFKIDPDNPDPGRVTLRRLNRVEYRHTIRDLTGVDFDTNEHFLQDDTGYGFDNIGDVLTLSPLLMEKYLQAAEQIVEEAVPTAARSVPSQRIAGRDFRSEVDSTDGQWLSFYTPAHVGHTVHVEKDGEYRFLVETAVASSFDFDEGRCRVSFTVDGQERLVEEYKWANRAEYDYQFEEQLLAGEHRLEFLLEPLTPEGESGDLRFGIKSVRLEGPLDEESWDEPEGYRRFFTKGPPPAEPAERDAYAREVLAAFVNRAYRRPVDEETVDRLAALAKASYGEAGDSFEEGVARAIVAVLASPRFLFRVEAPDPAADDDGAFPLVDEHALASRLSYFLWSTMPDDRLRDLADRGELRANLPAEVERMLHDRRSKRLVENFVGQWLRSRDVQHINIDVNSVTGLREVQRSLRRLRQEHRRNRRDKRQRMEQLEEQLQELAAKDPAAAVERDELDQERGRLQQQIDELREQLQSSDAEYEDERERLQAELARRAERRNAFSHSLRRAMRLETEACFEHLMREDGSLLDLLDADYTFVNEELANYYGIPGVEGREMRRVELPEGSPRGGVLTQGTTLVVTSNPTRTSPVKRGMHILENILGTPAPPPPPDIPTLEQAAPQASNPNPTGRELLEIHRQEPLCYSCHARMDPLGLALENFDAVGTWRDLEKDQPIDPSGQLLTGEEFSTIQELKQILIDHHPLDFYRCLTEKMLTYALGRGLAYYDEHTVDTIVGCLDSSDGRVSALVMGIIDSAPFQRQRRGESNRP